MGITWIANTNVHDRIVLVIGRIQEHDADIVALQEFYDYCEIDVWKRNIVPVYPYIAKGPSSGYLTLSSGMMILNKYPIIEHAFVPFSRQSWLDAWACPKGYLNATIRYQIDCNKRNANAEEETDKDGAYDLVLYNVHTTPGTHQNTTEDKNARNLILRQQLPLLHNRPQPLNSKKMTIL